MAKPVVLDRGVLDRLLETAGGDESFLADLIDAYLDDTPRLLAAMGEAVATGDAEGLRRAAHSLASNSATFGALPLAGLCRELEAQARVGTIEGVASRVTQARADYEHVKRALQARCSGGDSRA